jgi:hypothetical protein
VSSIVLLSPEDKESINQTLRFLNVCGLLSITSGSIFPKATNLNSSFSASNGSTKKPSHSIFNSSPLNNFQHHFLERLANLFRALVRRGKALAEITGTLEPGRTSIPAKGRFARDAQSNLAIFNDAIVVLLVGHFLRSQAAALV